MRSSDIVIQIKMCRNQDRYRDREREREGGTFKYKGTVRGRSLDLDNNPGLGQV